MVEITLALFNLVYFESTKWFWHDIVSSPRHYLISFILYFSAVAFHGTVQVLQNPQDAFTALETTALIYNAVLIVVHHLYVFLIWTNKIKQEGLLREQHKVMQLPRTRRHQRRI